MLDQPADGLVLNRQRLPFELDAGIARDAAIGLVVLATDHTIEHEWRQMLAIPGVAFYESRIYNAPEINPGTLREMEKDIAHTAALIRPGERIDVLAFGCTSGTIAIGEERVFEVQPKASTSMRSPGRMRAAVRAMSFSISRSVSGLISGALWMRLS